MKYYAYIMTNKYNMVYYVGVTNNLSRRVQEHKDGKIEGFTKRYNLHKLVYAEGYDDVEVAIAREKQMKGLNRAKKTKLIESVNPDWEEIQPL